MSCGRMDASDLGVFFCVRGGMSEKKERWLEAGGEGSEFKDVTNSVQPSGSRGPWLAKIVGLCRAAASPAMESVG